MPLNKEQYPLIKTDSRDFKAGEIFLALKGKNFDAHDFIDQVLEQGASLVYSEKAHQDPRVEVVDDCLQEFHRLANEYRKLIDPIVIGITGSAGKTTTKELLASILKEKYRVHYTSGNFNNEIGLPKTILSMPADTEVLILEMAMRGLGEIELLSKTAQPNIAVITNIGTAHIERLGSKENIKQAKLEITTGLQSKGLLVLDEDLFTEVYKDYKEFELVKFSAQALERDFQANYLISEGLLASIDATKQIALDLDLNESEIEQGLKKFNPGKGRGQFIESGKNIFIDETYNSNPEAIRNSIHALLKTFPDQNKIAVLGDINESQEELVDQVFAEVKQLENEKFKLIDARGMDANTARQALEKHLSADKQNIILIKASRSAEFENCISPFGKI